MAIGRAKNTPQRRAAGSCQVVVKMETWAGGEEADSHSQVRAFVSFKHVGDFFLVLRLRGYVSPNVIYFGGHSR